MEVNYEKDNLVNLSNSILKYFGIKTFHNTIEYVDILLKEKKFKNVILFVCDGLGYYNLNQCLTQNCFLRKKQVMNLKSVFPSTTTSATTSLLTGLTPSEHNWLGWDMFFKDTAETISLYLNKVKDTKSIPKLNVYDRSYMKIQTIVDLINNNPSNLAYYAYPFSVENKCINLDEVINRIEELTKDGDKKFIYAYIENPDKLMHKYGIYSNIVKDKVKEINSKLESLSRKIKDTVIFVTADHGLISTNYINLKEDMKELYDMLSRTTSIESRCVGLKLKEDININEFINYYNKNLKSNFQLLSVNEVIENKLFGNVDSTYLRDAIGDYLLVAVGNKSINYDNNSPKFRANHAGYTKDEMIVPLIVIECK